MTELPDIGASRFDKAIYPEAVFLLVDLLEQSSLQCFVSHLVNPAFKNGLLNPLPCTLADLGNSPKPLSPFRGIRGDVVANNDEHFVNAQEMARSFPFLP